MSKHLRFGKLLGMLAIMLTLSFAWNSASAQNSSSVKLVTSFSVPNQVGSTVIVAPNASTGAIGSLAITVPYATNVASLVATYTVSPFAQMYWGKQGPGAMDVSALMTSGSVARNYSNGTTTPTTLFVTVEAENHSYDYYSVSVTKVAPLTGKVLSPFRAVFAKTITCPHSPVVAADLVIEDAVITQVGNTITMGVKYGARLEEITIYFGQSAGATVNAVSGTAYAFGSGVTPAAKIIRVTAEDGTFTDYTVIPVISDAKSVADDLIKTGSMTDPSMGITGAVSVVSNPATQVITVVMPYSATAIAPTWKISDFAHMYTTNPQLGSATEICSGASFSLTSTKTDTETFSFWIQAEEPTEVSEWQLSVTNATAKADNSLLAITGDWVKTLGCGPMTGTVAGTSIVNTGTATGTVVFNVPTNTTGVTVKTPFAVGTGYSALATTSVVAGTTVLTSGSTFTITSESLVVRTITVTFNYTAISTAKQLLTFGFKTSLNSGWGFPAWTVDKYSANHSPVNLADTVWVAWNTDVYRLIPFFTVSDYACVAIAESNGTNTSQTSDVTYNDYSNRKTYVVTAENGTQERYEITVLKTPARTGNDLSNFQLTTLANCFGSTTYSVAGTLTGTNVAVSVKYGTNLTALAYSFDKPAGSTCVPSNTGTANFTSPVTFTVTSEAGAAKVFTVTVTPRAENTGKSLLTYWFAASNNGGLGADASGTVDQTAKTVTVWVPWESRNNVNNLVASFTLSSGAVMTHSEDTQFLQVSGTTANDFTTPVAYTVYPESCAPTVEYFVTVKVSPNTLTGISAFAFGVTPCATGCPLVNTLDPYARRIFVTVPYGTNLSSLAPSSITYTSGATVTVGGNPWTTAVDWTKGPVTYKVTSPDGTTSANWTVSVTAPKCTEHDILTFSLPTAQVATSDIIAGHGDPVTIDKVNHTITVIIKKDLNLSSLAYTRTLSCGATICCVGGNCQDNLFLDFSQGGCHTCVVTAEDPTVTQAWTICLKEIDTTIPKVNTWSVMAMNCTDSVAVQSNEAGRVFIVHESVLNQAVNPWVPNGYNLANWAGAASVTSSVNALVANHLGAWASVSDAQVNTPVYVKTNGLYSGTYWAYSVDNFGNMSCISDQKLYLDICEVPIADLCTLRAQTEVFLYTVTGSVTVTYLDTDASGVSYFFAQDATCGIMVKDATTDPVNGIKKLINNGTIKRGSTITGLKGKLSVLGENVILTPVCCYLPTVTGQGVEVAPIELTYDEFNDKAYGSCNYEAMVVKITTPVKITPNTGVWAVNSYYNLKQANGQVMYYTDVVRTLGLHTNYMGAAIPTSAVYVTGIRYDADGSGPANSANSWGYFFPRDTKTTAVPVADIMPVAENSVIISALPNPVEIKGVIPGQCLSASVKVFNEGLANMNITALYLDDAAATDGFNLVTPPAVPFTIGSWSFATVTVNFCPLAAGNKSTNLVVEYGVGKTLRIPINGTTVLINSTPFVEDFNAAIWNGNFGNGWTTNGTAAGNTIGFFKGGWYGGNARTGGSGYAAVVYAFNGFTCYAMTPGFNVTGDTKYLTFYQGKRDYFLNGTAGTTAIATDVRKVWISTDNQATWSEVYSTTMDRIPEVVVAAYIQPLQKVEISLAAYAGKTVFFKFAATRTSANRGEWFIDDVTVAELISKPILTVAPSPIDFGGVQLNATGTATVSITNTGISVAKITKIELIAGPLTEGGSNPFTLVDTNVYPVEVSASSGFAYAVGNTTNKLTVTVNYTPTTIGVATAHLKITYGLYEATTANVALSGEGLSCYTAAPAVIGRNWAPSQNTWFKYTADKFSLVQVTSCDVHQAIAVAGEYSWDTFLYVYSDCAGTLIGSSDDMEAACSYNRASSSVVTALNGGESINIFWPLSFPTSLHAYEGFYFNINVTYPLDGDVCENAIPLTLPVVNHFGTTVGFADDYNSSPCSPYSNYMDGNDKVYTVTVEDGYLIGNILGAYGSIHVLDVCPKAELTKDHCKAFVGGPNGGQFRKKIVAGTYFVIISTWAPPQTVDYLLNMSWESGAAVDNSDLMSSLSVYPNPTNGKFTVSINNPEAANMTLELVNISGQVVYRNEVKGAYSYNEDIDASSFAKGVYYLKVNDGKGVKVEKVVVQ